MPVPSTRLGTGKTTAGVELIRQEVARGARVLACSASNIAVDNLVERLAATPPTLPTYPAARAAAASVAAATEAGSPSLLPGDLLTGGGGKATLPVVSAGGALKVVRMGHPARLLPAVLECSLEAHVLRSDNSSLARDCRK